MPIWDQIKGRMQNRKNEVFEHQLSKRHLEGETAMLEMVHRHGFFQEGWVRVL